MTAEKILRFLSIETTVSTTIFYRFPAYKSIIGNRIGRSKNREKKRKKSERRLSKNGVF